MSKKDKARAIISSTLGPGEVLWAFETAQLKGGALKRLLNDLKKAPLAIALGVIGIQGGVAATAAPMAWVAITDRRLLMFRDNRDRRDPVGDFLIEMQRGEFRARTKSRLGTEVAFLDADSDEPVFRMNFGMFRGRAASVARAANHEVPGSPAGGSRSPAGAGAGVGGGVGGGVVVTPWVPPCPDCQRRTA